MATKKEREAWKAQAEQRMAESKKEKEEEIRRQELALHLRGEQKAAENKAEVKRQARRVWIAEGGAPAAFEKAWPKLYEDLVYARTVKRMASGDPFNVKGQLEVKL